MSGQNSLGQMSGPATRTIRCAELGAELEGSGSQVASGVSDSLAACLTENGWTLFSNTSESRIFVRNGQMVAVDQLIGMLASGHLATESWIRTCAMAGISDLQVSAPVALASAPINMEAPEAPVFQRDPFDVTDEQAFAVWNADVESAPWWQRGIQFAMVALVIVAVIYTRAYERSDRDDHLAGHYGIEGETEVPADGVLAVAGGRATLRYSKRDHEFESTSKGSNKGYYDDIKFHGDRNHLNHWGSSGRNGIGISWNRLKHDLSDPEDFARWINARNAQEDGTASRGIDPRVTSLAGRRAYVWEYTSGRGNWYYVVRIPDGLNSYSVDCKLMARDASEDLAQRCHKVVSTLKIEDRQ